MTFSKISQYLLSFLVELLNIPSPTGYTEDAIAFVEKTFADFPDISTKRTNKGALLVKWAGISDQAPRALTAHIDTLGAVVKEIKANGRLQISRLGGLVLNGVESEGCWVHTQSDVNIRGSFLLNKASSHVHGNATSETLRKTDTMEIRLDARTVSAEETRALGIQVGDFISFDPRVEQRNGFIRSRHLDDKAGVAALVTTVKIMIDAKLKPTRTTYFLISNFEEVGHGAPAGLPDEITELVAIDMAAIGQGQESDEFHATLCIKDSSGPYHHGLSNHLRKLAADHKIPHKVDIYPYYGSDGSAAMRAGRDMAVALIGPGVDASHSYERTHTNALLATTQWIIAYLLSN